MLSQVLLAKDPGACPLPVSGGFFSQKNFKHRLVYPIKDDTVLIEAQSGADPGDVDKILSNGESGSFECLVFSTETDF